MRRRAILVLVWLLFAPVVGRAQERTSPLLGSQILTAEEIRQAGLLRPSDLFRMLNGWTFSPRDGWHGDLNAGALGDSGWEVWIDGHRITTPILGAQDLNLLPISLEDVDFVEAIRHPTFVNGVLAGGGLLHIHTKMIRARTRPEVPARTRPEVRARTRPEIRARASAWLGNESGDPGPLRFVGDETPNVDHLGPDYAASAEWADRDLRVLGRLVRRKHYATDAAIFQRHQSITVGYPSMELEGGAVRIHVPGRSTQDLVVQLSRLRDFFFLEPYGREIPTVTRRTFAGIRGAIPLGLDASLRYRAAFSAAALARRPNLRNLDLDWNTERTDGAIDLHFGRSNLDVQVGMSVSRHVLRTIPALRDPSLTEMDAHVRVAGQDGLGPALVVQLRDMGGHIGLSGLVSMTGRPTRRQAYELVLAYIERPPYEEHPLWYWTARGYRLLEVLEISSTILHDPAPSRHVTVDARWRTDLSDAWSGTLGIFGRIQTGRIITLQTLRYESDGDVTAGPVTVAGPFAGVQYGIEAELNGAYPFGMRQDLYLRWLPLRTGDRSLRDAEGIWPRLEMRGRWNYRPAPGIWLSAQIAYRSATDWHGFERIPTDGDPAASAHPVESSRHATSAHPIESSRHATSGGLVESSRTVESLPSVWTLDLSATKSFWRERFYLTIDLRNVLNRTARYHPIGGRDDFSLFVRVVAEID